MRKFSCLLLIVFAAESRAVDCNTNGTDGATEISGATTNDTNTSGNAKVIPDSGNTGNTCYIVIQGDGMVSDVNVKTNIRHTAVQNLTVTFDPMGYKYLVFYVRTAKEPPCATQFRSF